jgi:hypothetical protein
MRKHARPLRLSFIIRQRTRVEQRASPSFDGGPMTMGMVIVCDD